MMTMPFSSLPALSGATLSNLTQLGYETMTPVQAQSLPLILQGKDLIVQAKTGSGKTAAFGLGIVQALAPGKLNTQALVLCPTRELAEQVAQELRRLARALGNIKVITLCGGTPIRPQAESLKFGAHVVVGTPGRLMDHIDRATVDLSSVNILVLDEADRMLDMGFYADVTKIVDACPRKRQTLLFSATYAEDIRKASARFLRQPTEVKVESVHEASQIRQIFYEVDADRRLTVVAQLLQHFRPMSALAFCNTKAQCREVAQFLQERGFTAMALHGDLEQRDREDVLVQFANHSCTVLVATDVAARGLDIEALDAVINVEITPDPEVHIHRIGRTGRAQAKGLAVTLCTKQEMRRAQAIEAYQGQAITWADVETLKATAGEVLQAPMVTLCIQGGKKDKLRPGDVLGALTKDAGFAGEDIGKINILEFVSFVAVKRRIAKDACARLAAGNIKGRSFRVRPM